jgi:1,4-dihydroxy-2-naphthoyl-CoA hydrolase
MFEHKTQVRLHDTDAAGLLFFGHQFKLAHDAYETMMEEAGFSLARILKEGDILLGIVRAEADFSAPLFVGDRLTITVKVERVGRTSFILVYELTDADRVRVGSVRTVHVCMDRTDNKKRPLPDSLKAALSAHL